MKKNILVFAILVLSVCSAISAWAAGSCTQSPVVYTGGFATITFVCTGDSSNGSIPNTAISSDNMAAIQGKYYLYLVRAYPTSGGTAPDAADVFILDAVGEDYLGSADCGTTANKGANLIHATLPKSAIPFSYNMSSYYYFPVTSTLTLKVASQATASANYTIELTFVR